MNPSLQTNSHAENATKTKKKYMSVVFVPTARAHCGIINVLLHSGHLQEGASKLKGVEDGD